MTVMCRHFAPGLLLIGSIFGLAACQESVETKPADALPEATNASQIAMAESAQQTFEEVASQAYLAMRKTQSAGGEWRGISEILKKAASVAQNGDFKRATRLAENAQEKAEEAYKRAKAKN